MPAVTKRKTIATFTEPELIAAIDKARVDARCLEIDADALDRKAMEIFRNAPRQREKGIEYREEAKAKRRRAASLCDVRIPKLSRALAAVRTIPLSLRGGQTVLSQTLNEVKP